MLRSLSVIARARSTSSLIHGRQVVHVRFPSIIEPVSPVYVPVSPYATVNRKDTKAAFQEGNVKETIAKWEREANISELNLATEKLGLDRSKYKDVSIQLSDIITLRTKLLGNTHPETIYSNAILAGIYRVVSKHKSAANIIEQCVGITEKMIHEFNANQEYTKKDLYVLFASCVEEYARIHNAMGEYEKSLGALKQGISVVDLQISSKESSSDYAVHLISLHRLHAETCIGLHRYPDAKEAIQKSTACIAQVTPGTHLRYYLLNHWSGESSAHFQNRLIASKLHSHLSEWDAAESELQSAWKIAVESKGKRSVECCNAFLELLDFYAALIPTRMSSDDYIRLLKQALQVSRSTDAILRKTRGLDKRIVYPYFQVLQRGLKTLLPQRDQREACIGLLYECLRVHEKYPTIYPTNSEDIFAKVMSLVQLLREESKFEEALELITSYKDQFMSLKEKHATHILPLVEVQAQLIISVSYGKDPLVQTGNIPLGEQMKVTTQTRSAVEGLEYVTGMYLKRKNTNAAIKSLHALAIIQTLQEEYSYADRDGYRAIKLIDPTFKEFTNRVEISDNIPLEHLGRLSDLLILRGSLLRVLHEPVRSVQYFKSALKYLSISRTDLTDDKVLKISDDLSRASDIVRCLDLIIEISETTQKEQATSNMEGHRATNKLIQACKTQRDEVVLEINRLHVAKGREAKKASPSLMLKE